MTILIYVDLPKLFQFLIDMQTPLSPQQYMYFIYVIDDMY